MSATNESKWTRLTVKTSCGICHKVGPEDEVEKSHGGAACIYEDYPPRLVTVLSQRADRIVATMNACAGMSDPVAEIARLREDVENGRAIIKALIGDDNPPLGQPGHVDFREAVKRGRALILSTTPKEELPKAL